jgi:hypothetical protein
LKKLAGRVKSVRNPLKRTFVLALVPLAVVLLGAECVVDSTSPPPGSLVPSLLPPEVSITLNGVSDELNDLLIVPPVGFVVNIAWKQTQAAINFASFQVMLSRDETFVVLRPTVPPSGAGSFSFVYEAPSPALAPGSYRIQVYVADVWGLSASAALPFAVRPLPSPPPIGQGQVVWFDFDADRDGVPGPDFAVDLEAFGLASPAQPGLSASVREAAISLLLDRVAEVYHDGDPARLGHPDPVEVTFTGTNSGLPDTTRICVGGRDPSGSAIMGSIMIDPRNAIRNSVECGTIPPTGIFPREMINHYSGQASFRLLFDPLRPAAGGTPVGAHPLDAIVLDPGFDPGLATAEELARAEIIDNALLGLADALGSIMAHETGHALGLVPPGPPGGGLFGGSADSRYAHNVMPSGSSPSENLLMNSGGTFSFAKLAGLDGYPLPKLRPLNHAYLRDRIVIDAKVTAILPAPRITSVAPTSISSSIQLITVAGSGLAATPALRLRNASWVYDCTGEKWLSADQMTASVVKSQLLPGLYDLELTNPDGQIHVLAGAIEILP